MKKILPYLIAVVVIAAAAGAFLWAKKDNSLVASKEGTSNTKTSTGAYNSVDACTVVTQADADVLLGPGSTKGDSTGDTSSDDINVSTCSYTQTNLKGLTLLARSAKTADGAESNQDQFSTGLPNNAQKIEGFGDSAYWDPTYGQMNILANNNWYILSNGGLRPSDKTIDEGKAFATRIISRL